MSPRRPRKDDLIDPNGVPTPQLYQWLVVSKTEGHIVVTDETRVIVEAPDCWRKSIGMELKVLLEQEQASAKRLARRDAVPFVVRRPKLVD